MSKFQPTFESAWNIAEMSLKNRLLQLEWNIAHIDLFYESNFPRLNNWYITLKDNTTSHFELNTEESEPIKKYQFLDFEMGKCYRFFAPQPLLLESLVTSKLVIRDSLDHNYIKIKIKDVKKIFSIKVKALCIKDNKELLKKWRNKK